MFEPHETRGERFCRLWRCLDVGLISFDNKFFWEAFLFKGPGCLGADFEGSRCQPFS